MDTNATNDNAADSLGAYIDTENEIVEIGLVDEMDEQPGDGLRMVYLPLGGDIGDVVDVDDDGEAYIVDRRGYGADWRREAGAERVG